jgi:hypothetical protein
MSSRKMPATSALIGAISRANPSARTIPAAIAATGPSQSAQLRQVGRETRQPGQGQPLENAAEAEPQRDKGEQRQAEGLEEDPAELGGEKAGERGARGVEDHGSLLRPQIVAP